jgi:lipopolysaccharide/colanic/teichoic acid biosynthesis glycosyltransferase
MQKNTPEVGTHLAEQEFKLRTGAFLRKSKLDEFPQLINVIKGDINLVGPRPCLVERQTELRNARSEKNIFDVKPGITGLAQVLNYDMSNPVKLAEIDSIYMKNQSLKMNVIILMATFFNYPRRYLRTKFIKQDRA